MGSYIMLLCSLHIGSQRDNLAKDVQRHFIRGPWLKQHNFHSKTYASNSKHHIYDRNMCPKHRDVNWMVYNRVIRFEMSPPEPFEICYFGQYNGFQGLFSPPIGSYNHISQYFVGIWCWEPRKIIKGPLFIVFHFCTKSLWLGHFDQHFSL